MNILFDLDGTLTDPGDGFVACVSYALEKLDCRRFADHEIRCHVRFMEASWTERSPVRPGGYGSREELSAAGAGDLPSLVG